VAQNNPVNDEWARRIRELWEWKQGFGGDFVRSTGKSVYVGSPPVPRRNREQRPAPKTYLCKTTGTTAISTGRWWYDLTEVRLSGSSTVVPDNPRLFEFAEGTAALNGLEFPNDDAGVQGNGVDLDGQIFTDNSDLEIAPIGTGAVVEVRMYPNESGGLTAMFFAPNAIDGECAE
jgi:hypothetical protein